MPKDAWKNSGYRAKYGPVGKLNTGRPLKRKARNRVRPPKYIREAARGQVCPDCGKPMAVRFNGKTGEPFLGCTEYPTCTGTRRIQEPPLRAEPPVQPAPPLPVNEHGEAAF